MVPHLPLVEKIFQSKENIEVFSQVANRLDSLMLAERLEELGLLD